MLSLVGLLNQRMVVRPSTSGSRSAGAHAHPTSLCTRLGSYGQNLGSAHTLVHTHVVKQPRSVAHAALGAKASQERT